MKQSIEQSLDLFGERRDPVRVVGLDPDDFQLRPEFLTTDAAANLFAQLHKSCDWREEYLQLFGKRVRSPRLVCWYGEPGIGYTYSGVWHQAERWLPQLDSLKERLESEIGARFNFVLVNLYQNQSDSMGWHADDEPELGPRPVIASVSLGAARTFRVRPASKKPGQRRLSAALTLEPGSLLVMRGASQTNWHHSLPPNRAPCGPRINLTFRYVNTPRGATNAAQ